MNTNIQIGMRAMTLDLMKQIRHGTTVPVMCTQHIHMMVLTIFIKITNPFFKSGVYLLDKKDLSNEYGESITLEEAQLLIDRIRALPPKKIDLLWREIGFIYSDRNERNMALTDEALDKIKNTQEGAETYFVSMFNETHIERIKEKLELIENDSKQSKN